jgi:mRNA interferase RelE/StbE
MFKANPLARGSLSGLYKLRAGDWRIIYEAEHADKVIFVHRIGHRREIYRYPRHE